jgi:hypothetical protein
MIWRECRIAYKKNILCEEEMESNTTNRKKNILTLFFVLAMTLAIPSLVFIFSGSDGETVTCSDISLPSIDPSSNYVGGVNSPSVITASSEALNTIQTTFGLQFAQPFYATDTNNDSIADTFTDPSHLLTLVRVVNVSGNASFLLSTGNDTIPEFFWDTNANKTVLLTFTPVLLTETWIDPESQEIFIVANVEKTNWVYIKIIDPYPHDKYPSYTLNVTTTNDRNISSNMIWRENGSISILDDPSAQYILIYGYTILPPVINPMDGTILHIARPTITITFFEETIPAIATFGNNDILDQLTTTDQKTFIFTPLSDLVDGTYTLSLLVADAEGNTLTSTSTYTINITKTPTGGIPWIPVTCIAILLIILVIIFILRKRLII